MRKVIRSTVLALAVTAAVAAAGAVPAFAKDRLNAAMSTTGFAYLPLLVADAMGFYGDQNLDVQFTLTGGDSKSMAALVGGGAQVYAGAVSPILRARASGTEAVAVGAILTQYASNLAMSGEWAKSKGITPASPVADKIKALRGATVAITAPGSGTDHLMRFLAKSAGLDPERDMTITALGTGETMTAALLQKRIDGFTVSAPAAENAVKNHGAIMLLNFARAEVKELDGFLYIGFAARESWAKDNPDLLARFLKAEQLALDAIHDPALTAKARDAVWAKYHGKIEKAFYDEVWAGTADAYPRSVVLRGEQISRIVKFVNEFDKQPLDPAAAAKAWTDVYAKKAVALN